MSQYISYSSRGGSGGGVQTYANLAAFPSAVTAGNGALAIALDTNILYESNGTSWLAIASPSTVLSIGSPANGLSLSSNVLSLALSSTSTTGALSNTDWNTFNNKQSALTFGNLTDAGTDGITITGGTGAVIGSGTTISQQVADTTHNGYLSSTDWNTFNNKGSGTVTAVSVSSANGFAGSSSGGTTPALTLSTTITGILQGNGTAISAATTGNLTDVGTDGITITSGTGAVLGSGTAISQRVSDSTHNGYLSSTDWNTFNNKQSALTLGNLTGQGFTVTGGTGAVVGSGASIAMTAQNDIWVSRQGTDTAGAGTIANPCQTVGYALTLVTSPSSTNNWTIHLLSGRHDQEVNDLLITPYTWIVGNGGPDAGSYLRLPSGKAIKLGTGWTSNARAGIQNIYLGGGTSVNLDFAAVGGSAGSNFELDDVFVTGTFTHTGRGVNGGDFLYIQNCNTFGACSFTGSEIQSFNSTYDSTITITTGTTVNCDAAFIGGLVVGNVSITQSGSPTASFQTSGVTYQGTFTTTGTITFVTDDNLPPGYSLSGGTSITYTKNAKSLNYVPTTSANWNSVPSLTANALDTLSSSGVVKSQTQNLVLASPNGSSGVPSFRALVSGDISSLTGNLTDAGTDGITVTGGTGAVVGSGTSIAQHVADTSHNGYLSSPDWNTFNGKQAAGNYITALTGDATASGPGSAALTLATVNSNVGSFGSSTSIPTFTVNAKGLVTAASGNAVIAPASTLTGTTLASNVVTSSLTSVGTITSGTWTGTTIAIANGGTGQTSTSTAFNALSPLTTKGDISVYSTTNTRQPVGADGQTFISDSAQTTGLRWATVSAGPTNYITYNNFENNATTGWSLGTIGTLTNGLPTGSPTFGSGASGNLSIATVSSGQLAGSYSLSLASSAATTQGNMLASQAYTIYTEDQAKSLAFKFYYTAFSGTANCNFSGTSSNSFAVAIYDVTNSVFIPVAGAFNLVQGTGVGIAQGTFQTASNTASIRLIIYNANATAGAATLYLDDFYVGPQSLAFGPAMSDMTSYTPTYGGFGTVTNSTMFWARRGDRMIISGTFTTGTVAASVASVSLPSGYTLDSTKLTGSSVPQNVGILQRKIGGAGYQTTTLNVLASLGSSNNNLYFCQTNGGSPTGDSLTPQNGNASFNSTESSAFYAEVPITGWSSNTVLSSDTDTRVVSFTANNTSNFSSTGSNNITFPNNISDSHGAWNGTDTYTIPVTGDYAFNASFFVSTASDVYLYKNGSLTAHMVGATGSSQFFNGGALLKGLKAGDTITFKSSNTVTLTASTGTFFINIWRLSGPAVITATESVNVRYHNSASAVTGSLSTIVWTTKDFDSHAAMNASTGVYTVPVSGKYQVNCAVITAGTFSLNNNVDVQIQKNGTAYTEQNVFAFASATDISVSLSDLIACNAGDTIQVQISSSAVSPSIVSSNTKNWISISRSGN